MRARLKPWGKTRNRQKPIYRAVYHRLHRPILAPSAGVYILISIFYRLSCITYTLVIPIIQNTEFFTVFVLCSPHICPRMTL